MSKSKASENTKRRIPQAPPPPMISGPPRKATCNNNLEAQYCRRTTMPNSCDTGENYESQYRKRSNSGVNDSGENNEHPCRLSPSPIGVEGPPPLKISKKGDTVDSAQHDGLVRAILNADDIKIPRRPEEGKKPIFDRSEIRNWCNSPICDYNMELAKRVPMFKPIPLYPAEIVDRYAVINPPSSSKRIDLQSEERATKKKFDKRRTQLEEIDEDHIKPGAICEEHKPYIKRKTRWSSHSSHSNEFGNLGGSKSEGDANAKATGFIHFKKLTLDLAANAPDEHPSRSRRHGVPS